MSAVKWQKQEPRIFILSCDLRLELQTDLTRWSHDVKVGYSTNCGLSTNATAGATMLIVGLVQIEKATMLIVGQVQMLKQEPQCLLWA